jgi:hypothetical protein
MVFTALAEPNESREIGRSGSSKQPLDAKAIRESFFSHLNDLKSIAKRKEFLLNNYMGLTEAIQKLETVKAENQEELASLVRQNEQGKRDIFSTAKIKRLRATGRRLENEALSLTIFSEHCVEEYLVLSSLEELEAKYKAKSLSKADYLQERRDLMAELAYAKQHRLLKDLTDDLRSAVNDLEEELQDIAYWIRAGS